jgi:hypothetical protein
MKSLRDAAQGLKWVQVNIKEDELISGKDVYAALHWASPRSSLATGESADGKWTFKRSGFIHPKISIRELGSDTNLYTVNVGWNGEASLLVPGKGTFWWVPNTWHTKWTLEDDSGMEAMRIELIGFINVSGNLEIKQNPIRIDPPTLSLLALLGWHLIMLVLSDDASSSAAIVAALP